MCFGRVEHTFRTVLCTLFAIFAWGLLTLWSLVDLADVGQHYLSSMGHL